MRDHLTPLGLVVTTHDETEVRRVLVGDLQPPRATIRVGEVIEAVFDPVSSRFGDLELAERVVGVEGVDLGRHRRTDDEEHDRLVARASYCDAVLRVALFVDQDVVRRVGPDLVAPQLPRAHRLVDPCEEDVGALGAPREAVVDVVQHVVDVALATERSDRDPVQLVAVDVGTHRDPPVVGADGEHADRQVVVTDRLDVLVQDDLLVLEGDQRVDHGGFELVNADGDAATDGVAQALASALEVPPRATAHRDRDVGLLDARLDLGEELVLDGFEWRAPFSPVLVLRSEERQHLRIVTIHEPVIGIDTHVAVSRDLVRSLRSRWWEHRSTLPDALHG